MSSFSFLEILASHGQYVGIVFSQKIEWPSSLIWLHDALEFMRIDLTETLKYLKWRPLDFRFQHVALTDIVPLVLSLFVIMCFKGSRKVILYLCLLCSIACVLGGGAFIFLSLISKNGQRQRRTGITLALVGSVVPVWLIIMSGVHRIYISIRKKSIRKNEKKTESVAQTALQENNATEVNTTGEKPGWRYSWRSQLMLTLGAIFFLLVGSGLMTIRTLDFWVLDTPDSIIESLKSAAKIIIFAVAILCFTTSFGKIYLWSMGHSQKTTIWNEKAAYWFQKNTAKIVVLIISVLYIPMSSSILWSFKCDQVTIPAGRMFIERQGIVDVGLEEIKKLIYRTDTYNISSLPCVFADGQCPVSNLICPQASDYRLHRDYSISCGGEIFPFFLPGSIMALLVICLGIPCLFFKVIQISVPYINQIPIHGLQDAEKREWQARCAVTTNCCRSLYSMFHRDWKYFRLVLYGHRFIIAVLLTWRSQDFVIILSAIIAMHTILMLCSLYLNPHIRLFEELVSASCYFANIINATTVLLVSVGKTVPHWMSYSVVSVNVIVPGIAAILGFRLESKSHQTVQKALKERQRLIEECEQQERAVDHEQRTKDFDFNCYFKELPNEAIPSNTEGEVPVEKSSEGVTESPVSGSTEKQVSKFGADESEKKMGDENDEEVKHKSVLLQDPQTVELGSNSLNKSNLTHEDQIDKNSAEEDLGKSQPYSCLSLDMPERINELSTPSLELNTDDHAQLDPAHAPKLETFDIQKESITDKQLDEFLLASGQLDAETRQYEINEEEVDPEAPPRAKKSLAECVKEREELASALKRTMELDRELDLRLIKLLSRFFFTLGVLAFLSFGVRIVPILLASLSENVYRPVYQGNEKVTISTEEHDSYVIEFAGYNNWEDFAAKCCCNLTEGAQNTPYDVLLKDNRGASLVEHWYCVNADEGAYKSKIVEKFRLRKTAAYSGEELRGYCAKEFKKPDGAEVPPAPMYHSKLQLVVLGDSEEPDFASKFLW